MRTRVVLGAVAVLVVVAAAVGSSNLLKQGSQQSGTSGTGSGVTLEDLVAGKFQTTADKQGTGGVTVSIQNLLVLYVRTESDGDWHVAVTDGKLSAFITEITPAYQETVGRPTAGTMIDETGIAYCDAVHETEAWHGDTCWEIHPVTAWQLSSSGHGVNSTTFAWSNLNLTFSYGENPIVRGSEQTITVGVADSDGPRPGETVAFEVDYASGYTARNFSCITATNGTCSVSWVIGANADPGTFDVIAQVEGVEFESNFDVLAG